DRMNLITGFLCSSLAAQLLNTMNPTLNILPGNIASLPILETQVDKIKLDVDVSVEEAVGLARADWNAFESSWQFAASPILQGGLKAETVAGSFGKWEKSCNSNISHMQQLETDINRLFIEAYDLQDEFSPEAPQDQITLARADAPTDIRRLVSYA